MTKTVKLPAKAPATRHEITFNQPGLEAALTKLIDVLGALANHELSRDVQRAGRDDADRRLEADRLALARAEHEQRVREWELEAAERRQRLAERRAATVDVEVTHD